MTIVLLPPVSLIHENSLENQLEPRSDWQHKLQAIMLNRVIKGDNQPDHTLPFLP